MFGSKRGSPYGNPGVGGRPFQLAEGVTEFNRNVFGDANAFIQQTARSGLLGRGGFEQAARALGGVQQPAETPSQPASQQPMSAPWPVWTIKPRSKVWVIQT